MIDSESNLPFVRLFTDGACRGNPGPGGWGCILKHPASGKEREFSGGKLDTTNNRMELQAVIEGLSQLTRRTRVEVVTDSKYVADGCRSWMPGWKRNGWKRKVKGQLKPVLNLEYWQQLDRLAFAARRVIYGGEGTLRPSGERALRRTCGRSSGGPVVDPSAKMRF